MTRHAERSHGGTWSRAQSRAAHALIARAETRMLAGPVTREDGEELVRQRWWMAFPEREAARLQMCQDQMLLPEGQLCRGLGMLLGRPVRPSEVRRDGWRLRLWCEALDRVVVPNELARDPRALIIEHQGVARW